MIPYVHVPSLRVGPLTLYPFGALVATAVYVGTSLASRRARALGLDASKLDSFVTWMLAAGFAGGHAIDALLYRPAEVLRRPWELLFLWRSQGSFGGFAGALVGVVLWKYFEVDPAAAASSRFPPRLCRRREHPAALLPFADLVLSVFPVAWIFGRMGCALAHDHPGVVARSDAPLAVAFGRADPAHVQRLLWGVELRYGAAPRYDLGTLELLFTVVLAAATCATWGRRRPAGFYVALVSLAYAPVRFGLDFLRARDVDGADARYASLTPAQWACVALVATGAVALAHSWRSADRHPRVG